MYSNEQEWELYLQELKKIDMEGVRTYLVGHDWHPVESQYGPRAQVYRNQGEEAMLLLPVSAKLSDYYQRLAEALRIMARVEGIWYPYLVERFIKQ